MKINVVYATSDLYSKPALISMKTLLMNNTDMEEINIYYVENGVSESNKKTISDLVNEYHRTLQFIPMPERLSEVNGFIRNNVIVYSYCYFQDILPADVDKVLLLEADSIVVGSLKEFYETDLSNDYIAAVKDMINKNIRKALKINSESPCVNCGILLFNLKKMREEHFSEKITKIIQEGKSKYFWEVQDEMNVASEGKIKILPLRFNVTSTVFLLSYQDMKRFTHPIHYYTEEEYDQAKKHPLIVHFTKTKIAQTRPWIENCTHPYKQYYIDVKNETALSDMALWPDERSKMSKLCAFLCSKGATRWVVTFLGWIRSVVTRFAFLYKYI